MGGGCVGNEGGSGIGFDAGSFTTTTLQTSTLTYSLPTLGTFKAYPISSTTLVKR